MKVIRWISNNIFFLLTLFLLAFIPLYPKLPVLDVVHTWVYIRLEDFIVAFVFLFWITLLLFKKVTLKTPLTAPIITFWIAGAMSTIHGVLLIFPVLSDVYPNVALLSYLRRIEYISLFFIAFTGMKDKRFVPYIIATLAIVLVLIVGYGFGQKYYGFPAYLTMNEEFAKGTPVQLSPLSRVPSTFAGHYDLAAYLVLVIPILISVIFGFRNWFIKFFLFTSVCLGFALLFMTVSRVSFFVLLLAVGLLLILQKKKLVILSIFVVTLILLSLSQSLLQRFGSTIKEVDVLVNAQTGEAIGHVKEVPASYFENKIVKKWSDRDKNDKQASESAIIPLSVIPSRAALVVEPNDSTGEDLPQGTSYINLPLSPITQKLAQYFYQESTAEGAGESKEAFVLYGDFLVKKAYAYDLSFTTRFQGEWPRALTAFKRNIIFGSGYSSVGLAVDNSYLRMLAEVGLLGFLSFIAIFLAIGIYIKKVLPTVDSPIVKSFVLGFVAGVFGLALNAVLIDVFEASKIAFILWLLVGIIIGTLHLYAKKQIDFYNEFKTVVMSPSAIIIYLFITTLVIYSTLLNYYFVGDDFTWLRWVADCNSAGSELQQCPSVIATISSYFTQANGFFYRPGTKIYFLLIYSGFWLNQIAYHVVSIALHFIVSVLVFLLSKKILKDTRLGALCAFVFLIISGYSEAVFWISATGFLFTAMFSLLSLLFYIAWEEKKKIIYFILCLISLILGLLFHELGVVTPLLIILYAYTMIEKLSFKIVFRKTQHLIIFIPVLVYLILRFVSQSHWFSGDYSYNLFKLPYNLVGNIVGYVLLDLFGPMSLSIYQEARNFFRDNLLFVIPATLILSYLIFISYKFIMKRMNKEEQKIIVFGLLFFTISLLPFLGLGNITSRYTYLATVGIIILFVFFLNKFYGYLVNMEGKHIATVGITAISSIFILLQIIQLQQIHKDWYQAGEKSKKFFISLNAAYPESWTKDRMQFYFVNTPIRHGEAWIFPVGLSDALWFVFQHKNIDVYQLPSIDQAFNSIKGLENEKIFKFNDSGAVIEQKKELEETTF